MTRLKRTKEQWQTLLAEQADSGLTISKFCEQKQITKSAFYQWRKRLAGSQQDVDNPLDWLSLPLSERGERTDGWQIELTLPKGIILRMNQNS